MSDWPRGEERWGQQQIIIGGMSQLSLGVGLRHLTAGVPASAAWPAANRALLLPFRVPKPMTAYQIVVGCGSTAGGNFDAGIYDKFGNLLVSSGATARSASNEVVANITDTTLGRGVYYAALAVDGTNNMIGWSPANAGLTKMVGVRQASSAYTLPATITFETVAAALIPNLGVYLISQ